MLMPPERRQESSGAWKTRASCGPPREWPWPRRCAWTGSERTRSITTISIPFDNCRDLVGGETYGSVLGSLRTAALECDAVALVLQALGSDQALDLGGLGVGLGALLLGLDLATDDELADLYYARLV